MNNKHKSHLGEESSETNMLPITVRIKIFVNRLSPRNGQNSPKLKPLEINKKLVNQDDKRRENK